MMFNDLLRGKQINPGAVFVLRHRPKEAEFRKKLPWLAAEHPDVYNAYQQQQGEALEKAMQGVEGAGLIASFIGHQPGKAMFEGLYRILGSRRLTRAQLTRIPAFQELLRLGVRQRDDPSLWFDLERTPFYRSWQGKLVVDWPPPERSWWRRAHKNDIPVAALLEESAFAGVMPSWDALELSWADLDVLPTSWRLALSQWRGVYYIFDVSDAKGYVGSAYGANNIFGRWKDYAARGHGGNTLLRPRDPRNFRFSILQRVSPDMDAADIVALEASWKRRLHTGQPFGLNDN